MLTLLRTVLSAGEAAFKKALMESLLSGVVLAMTVMIGCSSQTLSATAYWRSHINTV
jgi:hypothetical protein